jgi:hypothetical protein
MTATLETAAAGYPVHWVCAEGKLGGIWGEQYKRVPFRAAAAGVPNGNDAVLAMPEELGVGGWAPAARPTRASPCNSTPGSPKSRRPGARGRGHRRGVMRNCRRERSRGLPSEPCAAPDTGRWRYDSDPSEAGLLPLTRAR